MYSQQFDDMLGLLQSLEARLADLHGKSVSVLACVRYFHFVGRLSGNSSSII